MKGQNKKNNNNKIIKKLKKKCRRHAAMFVKEVELLQNFYERRLHLFVCLFENLQQNPHNFFNFL